METRLILETGCNHQGSFDMAMQMIEVAAKLKVWGVKFQKRDIDSLPDSVKNIPRDKVNSFGKTYYQHRKALEFSALQMSILKKAAEELSLNFVCSIFDEKSFDEMIGIGCKFIKLPSQLYSNTVLHNKISKQREYKDFKIFVSTGMHEENEIFNNPWITDADVVFHCVSVYPHEEEEANIRTITRLLAYRSGAATGYSSHCKNGSCIPAAVICGAKYVERHFTLCKMLKGSDHGTVSSDPVEIDGIIKDIESVELVLGGDRKLSEKEMSVKKIYRG